MCRRDRQKERSKNKVDARSTIAGWEKYKEWRKKAKQTCKKKKRELLDNLLKELQEMKDLRETRNFYKGIRKILANVEDVLFRWKTYLRRN